MSSSKPTKAAQKWYRKVLQVEPDHINVRTNFGWSLLQQERYEEARGETLLMSAALMLVAEHLVIATRTQPDNVNAWFGLTRSLAMLKKINEARLALQVVLPRHRFTH